MITLQKETTGPMSTPRMQLEDPGPLPRWNYFPLTPLLPALGLLRPFIPIKFQPSSCLQAAEANDVKVRAARGESWPGSSEAIHSKATEPSTCPSSKKPSVPVFFNPIRKQVL